MLEPECLFCGQIIPVDMVHHCSELMIGHNLLKLAKEIEAQTKERESEDIEEWAVRMAKTFKEE